MKSLELFSGAGGLAQGLEFAGFQHTALVEWNKDACNSLRSNFKNTEVIEGDIRDFDFKQFKGVDLISGGPPCQPFSMGGKALGNSDGRDMFPYAINGIRELAPRAFMFENVKGLLRQSFSSYFNYIILQLTYPELTISFHETWQKHLGRLEKIHTSGDYKGLKYNVVYRLVNAANYGVPQKRERVIIVGVKDSLNIEWSFPKETHSFDSLVWSKFVTKDYWEKLEVCQKDREEINPQLKKKVDKLKARYGMFLPDADPWVTVREAIFDLPDPTKNFKGFEDHLFRGGARSYPGHTGSSFDEPAKTVKAGDHGVPGGENMIRFANGDVRYFTIREAKRIQTFPDSYRVLGSWTEGMRQLGNAVPVSLGHSIGKQLYKSLVQSKAI